MTHQQALKFLERLLTAKSLLVIHGLLSDGEREKMNARIDKWALKHGLQRKGTP